LTKDVKLTQRGADILIAALRVDLCLDRVPRYRLQSLKDRGLGLRRFGLNAESGLSEGSVGEAGPVLDALEPVFMMTARWREVPPGAARGRDRGPERSPILTLSASRISPRC
jgi:hypothetical protein